MSSDLHYAVEPFDNVNFVISIGEWIRKDDSRKGSLLKTGFQCAMRCANTLPP